MRGRTSRRCGASDVAEMATDPMVSVLFITYNRLLLLKRTLKTFTSRTTYPNLELVVADDGSSPLVQAEIRRLPFHEFVLSERNRGLGANANAGLLRCHGAYVLMIQDDWDCVADTDYLGDTIHVMVQYPDIGLVKYYGDAHTLRPEPRSGVAEPCFEIAEQEEMKTNLVYSDTPHVMSRAALQCIGPYREDCDMESCEMDYARRFGAQNSFKAAVFPAYYNRIFVHTGGDTSYRTSRARYRIDRALGPLARCLRRCPPAFRVAKTVVRRSVETLERLRVIR